MILESNFYVFGLSRRIDGNFVMSLEISKISSIEFEDL